MSLRMGVGAALIAALLLAAPQADARKKKPKNFVFLHDNGAVNQVHVLVLDSKGQLTPVAGSPFPTGGQGANVSDYAQSLAYAPGRRLLFVGGKDGITVFSVAKSGALTEAPGSPVAGDVTSLVALTRGSALFVYALAGEDLVGYQAGPDGTLTPAPSALLPVPDGVRLAGADNTLFVTDASEAEIRTVRVNPNGSLTSLNLSVVGEATAAFPVPPFLYCLPEVGDEVLVLRSLAIGTLQAAPGSPFDTGLGDAVALAHSPDFTFVGDDDEVNVFTRAANGALSLKSSGSEVAIESLEALAADAAGKFLVAVSGGEDLIRAFAVDKTSGALTTADSESVAIADGNSCTGLVVTKL
jgi:hypothetical protein